MLLQLEIKRESFGIAHIEVPENWYSRDPFAGRLREKDVEEIQRFLQMTVEPNELSPFAANCEVEGSDGAIAVIGMRQIHSEITPDISLMVPAMRAEAV